MKAHCNCCTIDHSKSTHRSWALAITFAIYRDNRTTLKTRNVVACRCREENVSLISNMDSYMDCDAIASQWYLCFRSKVTTPVYLIKRSNGIVFARHSPGLVAKGRTSEIGAAFRDEFSILGVKISSVMRVGPARRRVHFDPPPPIIVNVPRCRVVALSRAVVIIIANTKSRISGPTSCQVLCHRSQNTSRCRLSQNETIVECPTRFFI